MPGISQAEYYPPPSVVHSGNYPFSYRYFYPCKGDRADASAYGAYGVGRKQAEWDQVGSVTTGAIGLFVLEQVPVGAGAENLAGKLFFAVHGQHEDQEFKVLFPHFLESPEPLQSRHREVQ